MSNTRFSATNHCVTGTISTRTNEDASGVTESAIDYDRYTSFLMAATGEFRVHVDLGSAKSVKVMAVRNLKLISGVPSANMLVQSSTDNATWTTRATFSASQLLANVYYGDVFAELAAPISARYWRFNITSGPRYSCGGVWLGDAYTVDFGMSFTRQEAMQHNVRAVQQMIGGQLVQQHLGNPYETIAIVAEAVPQSIVDACKALSFFTTSFMYFDALDVAREVVVATDGFRYNTSFLSGTTAYYDIVLELRQLN
jgi:hypothetical protein